MKKQIVFTMIMTLLFLSGELFAGNNDNIKTSKFSSSILERTTLSSGDTASMKKKAEMKMDGGMKMAAHPSKLIRSGVINLEAIDKNHDGKLYEDVMDFNVISDKPGVCPICGMKLREMTIQQVKENLQKHGFKYK